MNSSNLSMETLPLDKLRASFRHELRSHFSVLIGFGEVLREDLAREKSNDLPEFDLLLAQVRLLLDDTINMINHCSSASFACFDTDVRNGLLRQTLPPLQAIHQNLTQLEERLGQRELLKNIEDAIKQIELHCHSPFERRPDLNKELNSPPSSLFDCLDSSTPQVLVIDDEPHNLQLIGLFLSRLNLSVSTFTSAVNALRSMENETYDLILLDLHMPVMGGLDFLRTIKADERFKDIPVLVVTASDDDAELANCFEAGAIDTISKPVQSAFLRSRVKTCLEHELVKKRERKQIAERSFQKK